MFARTVSNLLFGLFAGSIADRFNRRWLLLGGQLLLAVNYGALALLALADVIQPWHIGIGSFIKWRRLLY